MPAPFRLRQPFGRLAPGSRIVAGTFLLLAAGFGAIYSYAAFAEEIAGSFGAGRPALAVIFALSGGGCFLFSAVSGPLADRFGARPVAAFGMLMVGAGLMVAATARSLAEVYLGYGLMTGLGVGCAYVPALAAVQRAFTMHRGLASGIAVSGIGIGTALVPPVAGLLAEYGTWRLAFLLSGAGVALLGVGGAMLLPAAPARRDPVREGPSLPVRSFGLAYLGTLLVSIPAMLPHAALVGSALDRGLPRPEALALLGLLGVGTVLGRFLLAALADLAGRRRVFVGCCAGMAASMAAWAGADGARSFQAFALAFGAAQGGFVALLPVFVADHFGSGRLGRAMGLLYTSRGVALLAAPPALMLSAEWLGLAVPLLAGGLLGLLGALALALMPRCPRSDGGAEAAHPRRIPGRGGPLPAPQWTTIWRRDVGRPAPLSPASAPPAAPVRPCPAAPRAGGRPRSAGVLPRRS